MFTKKMLSRTSSSRSPLSHSSDFVYRRRQRKLSRFAIGTLLGVLLSLLLSIVLNGLAPQPTSAQTVGSNQIPNQATVQYDAPANGGGGGDDGGGDGGGGDDGGDDGGGTITRSNSPSNTVTYPLGAVLGENTLGLDLVKSADKSSAEPGDVVVYQLLVRNQSTQVANNVQINDTLPLGVALVDGSVTGDPTPPTSVTVSGRNLDLTFPPLAPGAELSIRYAAVMTPDAIRGDGRNIARASADGFETVESVFRLTIAQGILSDCGTIVGRVFSDKNFDGQQQPGEAGIPNAVIFMESGNRIITDPDGLFSIANALSGNRVGTLDLSSLPGYTLAPNLFRVEENSQSRLVRLSPGGLARMNFAVTPTFGEGEE